MVTNQGWYNVPRGGERGKCRTCHAIYRKCNRNDVECSVCAAKSCADRVPMRYVSGIGEMPYETADRWLTRNLRRVEADNVRMERDGVSGFPPQAVR